MPDPGTITAILPAAGSGQRFGRSANKLFALLDGVPLWLHSARLLRDQPEIGRIIMPIAASDQEYFSVKHAADLQQLEIQCVQGGAERSDSVAAALAKIDDSKTGWVAIHDAARPLVRSEDLAAVFQAAIENDAAILASPISGTVRYGAVDGPGASRTRTIDRRHLYVALTPQVFQLGLLRKAYAQHNGRPATDDAQLVERIGGEIRLVVGAADNLKITYPEDLVVAEAILQRRQTV